MDGSFYRLEVSILEGMKSRSSEALMTIKATCSAVATDGGRHKEQSRFLCPSSKSVYFDGPFHKRQNNHFTILSKGNHLRTVLSLCPKSSRCMNPKTYSCFHARENSVSCHSSSTHRSEAKVCLKKSYGCTNISSGQPEVEQDGENGPQRGEQVLHGRPSHANQGLAEACKYVCNDAKFVNERARSDIILLSRGMTRLNDRVRQDVAVIGCGFLMLDARAREDTEIIDNHMKKKAARLHHMATILKEKARSKLKNVADLHWSDGALEADLKRADFVARQRAMEDAFLALKFIRNIHNMMANRIYRLPQKEGAFSINETMGFITLEKNGKTLDIFGGDISTERITAIQDAYWSMASVLSEADGIDHTDPEELELLVATLIDLDAMDSKSSVTLLAECSISPDVSTRKALANALAAAPSMWILGNAGMGALQRLAADSNTTVAAAASKAINELKKKWELEEGDSLRFSMKQRSQNDKVDIDSQDEN